MDKTFGFLDTIVMLILAALAMYYFVYESDKSSKLISSSADATAKVTSALMGKGTA